MGRQIFSSCWNLKRAVLNEELGRFIATDAHNNQKNWLDKCDGMFEYSGLEEAVLPGTLREVSGRLFRNCHHLRIVWLEGDCAADVRESACNSVMTLPKQYM